MPRSDRKKLESLKRREGKIWREEINGKKRRSLKGKKIDSRMKGTSAAVAPI